ncbi:MAG: acetate kinase [Lachnospiraceae bacterium]|mgnify:FL=1|uniref:Acetate kinase n=1 Tax=Hominiventricola filiformis TaxID=2885352 RepID=A0AAE3DBM5_9FIRM|nr:acetate kinase [Hominiventricola filiformis]MCI6880584.1 acetate kinase [Clostridiaceae bacterium]MDY3826856.1 acetate kinase [Lachnospiraceae bacterium]QUO21829.1 acetate kinase [Clostridiaceae bacterium Marseille-Q4143]RHU86212.1 acetate kinase [Clostridiaceae bacterium OM08-6BH]MCC2125751.1 acetate kinase [Hominiventricola filiformis]
MKILVINCGSSSLKYQLIDMDDESVVAKGLCERIGIEGSKLTHQVPGKDKYIVEQAMPDHKVAIGLVLDALQDAEHGVVKSTDEIAAVGHRVLHAGTKYCESIVVNEDVKKVIRECFDLGPLHNPANLMGIEACEAVMPGKANVAVWDTAFGMSMPEKAYLYAIPHEYYEKYSIRRYGFHGTSHMFVSGEAIKFGNLDPENAKVIVCHLGNGASVSASIGGKCVDTSMGLTPLEGLIMGTRSGDIDPAVCQFICNKEGIDINEMLNILNKKSGVLGMSGGISSDFRDIEKAKEEGNHLADVALQAFVYRVAKYIGAYTAAMNGVDAIAFTAGVGENDKVSRKAICDYLGYLGVKIDDEANNVRGERRVISAADSKVKVMLIPTNEELAIARETLRLTK